MRLISRSSTLLVSVTLLFGLLLGCATQAAPATQSPTARPTAPPTSTTAPTPTITTSPSPTSRSLSQATPTAPSMAGFPITVTDDAGHTVTFDRPPKRIISLSPGHTETLYALGVGSRIIRTDSYSDYPPQNKPKATLVEYPKPNLEQIIALNPDLIVDLVEGNDFTDAMNAHGIKVLTLFPKTFDGTLKDIDLLGKVTGTEAQAVKITNTMRQRELAIEEKTKNAPKPRVLYELDATDPTKPWVAGPTGFFGNLVPLAGGQNIFADLHTSAAQVSAAQIIARNPQFIILGDAQSPYNAQTPAMVRARPGWNVIDAIRQNRVYPINSDYLSRPGPRLIDGLAQLAKLIHPELFK